jgi:hypothetical protein
LRWTAGKKPPPDQTIPERLSDPHVLRQLRLPALTDTLA